MNKETLKNALGLTCVENYFLAHFQDKFNTTKLYVNSFVSLDKIMQDFLINSASYEYYDIQKVHDLAVELNIVSQYKTQNIITDNDLNLIRVNRAFFDNIKLVPWREDHFIAIAKKDDLYNYINNYPLSSGLIDLQRLEDVFDNFSLGYKLLNSIDSQKYDEFKERQLQSIVSTSVRVIVISLDNIEQTRSALLVLATLRQRTAQWLQLESYESASQLFLQSGNACKKLSMTIELQKLRNKIDLVKLNNGVKEIVELEKRFGEEL